VLWTKIFTDNQAIDTDRCMKRIALALAATLSLAGAAAQAAPGDPVTPRQRLLYSATQVFRFDNNLGKLGVAVVPDDDNEAHIGSKFEINHAVAKAGDIEDELEDCIFTMRRRDGPIIQTIDFEKLSDEVRVIPSPPGPYVTLQVEGLPGAACDVKDGIKTCRAGLSMLLYTGSEEHLRVMRALRYIAANGCAPVALPPR
jgi:hypothetical protein